MKKVLVYASIFIIAIISISIIDRLIFYKSDGKVISYSSADRLFRSSKAVGFAKTFTELANMPIHFLRVVHYVSLPIRKLEYYITKSILLDDNPDAMVLKSWIISKDPNYLNSVSSAYYFTSIGIKCMFFPDGRRIDD